MHATNYTEVFVCITGAHGCYLGYCEDLALVARLYRKKVNEIENNSDDDIY